MPQKGVLPPQFEKTVIRSSEQAAELGRRGGKASGESKRKKKNMKQSLALLLDMPLHDGQLKELLKLDDVTKTSKKGRISLDLGKNITVGEAVLCAQIIEAIRGNVKAAEFLAKLGDMMDLGDPEYDDGFLEALNSTAKDDWSD